MPVVVAAERPDAPDARALIDELEAHLASFYPRESRHGYSVDKLLARGVAFFVLRAEAVPGACGGIELFGAELKRMYVRPQFRGRGFGKQLLERLYAHAHAHGVRMLRLETGIHQKEAIGLYEQAGFVRIPPFGDYREDPLSLFYERRI